MEGQLGGHAGHFVPSANYEQQVANRNFAAEETAKRGEERRRAAENLKHHRHHRFMPVFSVTSVERLRSNSGTPQVIVDAWNGRGVSRREEFSDQLSARMAEHLRWL